MAELTELQKRTFAVISSGVRHSYYHRTVELAELYMQVCTGKGAEKLLRKVNTNEDDELFAQRLKLTQIVTPSICHTITTPHYEMARVTPLTKSVVHQSQEVQDDIEDLLNGYYGGYGIDMFLCDNFLPYNTVDPNAFIITLHNENGAYSFVSKSEKNVDYKYDNNVLQYLITKTEVEYQEDGMPKMGERYTLYENGSLTTYTQVEWTPKCGTCFGTGQVERYYVIGGRQSDMCQDCNGIGKLAVEVGVSIDGNYLRTEDFRMFEIEKFDLKTPIIPCFRIGTIKDVTTDGETMVSMIDPAIPYLLKSIKTISELDVNVSLHAFLKKISYEPACQAQDCIQGKIRNGDDCKSCNGTGRLKADSAQTAIVLTLPDDPRDVISLANLAHYVELPIEVPKLLDDLVDKYEKKAIKAVYSTEIFEKSTVVATATEKLIENQAKNNTLYPLSMTYSFAYKYLSANVAHISGFKDFQVRHKFPKYLGLQSRENLVNELKTVKEAGLSGYVMEELESNYAKVLFADQQDELQRINQKKKFNPFKGKSPAEITFLIAGEFVDQYTITLYAYFDRIFQECEEESESVWFYKLPYNVIKLKLKEKVEQIIKINEAEEVSRGKSQRDIDPEEGDTGLSEAPSGQTV